MNVRKNDAHGAAIQDSLDEAISTLMGDSDKWSNP